MTTTLVSKTENLVSGSLLFKDPISLETIQETAQRLLESDPNRYLAIHVREHEESYTITFVYQRNPEVTQKQFVSQLIEGLRKRFSDGFRGVDISEEVWVIK